MSSETIMPESLQRIGPNTINSYALAKGWKLVRATRGVNYYKNPEVGNIQITIPQERGIPYYDSMVLDAVTTFAKIEKRDLRDVSADLASGVTQHRVEVRLQEDETKEGTIPLDECAKIIEGEERILRSQARAFLSPKYSGKEVDAVINELVQSCHIGPTRGGSYIISLICPPTTVPSNRSVSTEGLSEQITTSMMEALDFLVKSIEKGEVEHVVEPTKGAPRVSDELCRAIADMEPRNKRGSLDISLVGPRPSGEGRIRPPLSVHITKSQFREIRSIGEKIAEETTEKNHVKLEGIIYELKEKADVESIEGIQTVEVRLYHRRGELRVKVIVPAEKREIAIDAYRRKALLRVEGPMRTRGAENTIENPTKFAVIRNELS